MGVIDSFKYRRELIETFRNRFDKKPRITFKKGKEVLEERYPSNTELHDWIKYQLLFYKPLNDDTRLAANLLLHQTYELRSLLYDELIKLGKKTRNNYQKIIGVFEPVFNPNKGAPYPFEKPQFVFDYIMGIFTGEIQYDEKKLDENLSDENWRLAYKNYYSLCNKFLKNNEISNYMKKMRTSGNLEENEKIKLFLKRLDDTMHEFSDDRPMGADIYEIAVKYPRLGTSNF